MIGWPSVTVQYLVPLTIISYTYITISTRLWWSAPPGIQTPGQDRETLLRKRKIVQMLILVVVIFSLCWLPYHLYFIVSMCRPEINEFKYINLIFLVSHWLAMSNSCYNPFIYCLCSAVFRHDLSHLFCCFSSSPQSNMVMEGREGREERGGEERNTSALLSVQHTVSVL